MATFIGALLLILLGCVAVFGYLTESRAANRRRPAPPPPPQPAPTPIAPAPIAPAPETPPGAP